MLHPYRNLLLVTSLLRHHVELSRVPEVATYNAGTEVSWTVGSSGLIMPL